ncbi:MAG: hypothetical protein SFU56_14930 [Capsulimonadales bacterium]|nr:hypothetical protein [Capsulimonadales bacterium]
MNAQPTNILRGLPLRRPSVRPILAALLGAASLTGIAFAAGQDAWPNVTPDTSTEIRLGGEVIMRLEDAGGYSAQERAGIIRERLVPILGMVEPMGANVRVWRGPDDAWASIYVGNRLLVTVTESLARANNSQPFALAQLYADRFRRLLPQVAAVRPASRNGLPSYGEG